jgi:hypothetical protein
MSRNVSKVNGQTDRLASPNGKPVQTYVSQNDFCKIVDLPNLFNSDAEHTNKFGAKLIKKQEFIF